MAASGSTRKRGRYLLDTNIVTALFKQDAAVHAELAAAEQVLLSSTVLGELYYGAARSGRPQQNRAQLEEFAATCIILAVDHGTSRVYGETKSRAGGRDTEQTDPRSRWILERIGQVYWLEKEIVLEAGGEAATLDTAPSSAPVLC